MRPSRLAAPHAGFVLAASLVLGPTAANAGPALAAVADDEQVRVHLGADVDGIAEPRFDEVLVRSPSGQWSARARLPSPRAGIPLVHRGMTWILENRIDMGGRTYHVLLPVTGEIGLPGVRFEHVQGQRGVAAVQVIDDWTFVVAELGASGQIFGRVITSHGSSLEMEVLREETWNAGWAEGSRLLAAGEAGPFLVVMGSAGPSVIGSTHDGNEVAELPPLDVSAFGVVAACVTAGGPLVVGARGRELAAIAWSGTSWSEPRELRLPAGSEVAALSVTTVSARRDRAFAVALLSGDARALAAAPLSPEGAWGVIEHARLQQASSADGAVRPREDVPDLAGVERSAGRLRMLRWGLVIAAFPVLVLLVRQLARLRG